MTRAEIDSVLDTTLKAAREALRGAGIKDVEQAIHELISCSDLFDPVMIEAQCKELPLCEFCGMVVITILQIRGRLK